MDTKDTLRLETYIIDELREGGYRRDRLKRTWDGYSSKFSETIGSDKEVRDDIARRERMAEACYEV